VRRGDPLLDLHYRERRKLDAALALLAPAVEYGEAAPPARRNIVGEVR